MKYWKCRRKYECNARLTIVNNGCNLLTRKGVEDDSHNHAQNPEDVEALRIIGVRILDNGLFGVGFYGLETNIFDWTLCRTIYNDIYYYGFVTAALIFQY